MYIPLKVCRTLKGLGRELYWPWPWRYCPQTHPWCHTYKHVLSVNFVIENEELLQVTGSYLHCKRGNVWEMVRSIDKAATMFLFSPSFITVTVIVHALEVQRSY